MQGFFVTPLLATSQWLKEFGPWLAWDSEHHTSRGFQPKEEKHLVAPSHPLSFLAF